MMILKLRQWIFVCGMILFFSVSALANDVPDVLKPWESWVLKDQTDRLCPSAWNQADNHYCEWPAYLNLNIDSSKGTFEQQGVLFNRSWVALVGDQQHWPLAVRNLDAEVAVVDRNGQPSVLLEKGEYTLTGQFSWKQTPEKLSVPNTVGIIKLSIDSAPSQNIDRDNRGFLWLKRKATNQKTKVENSLSIKSFRKIKDSIPQELEWVIRLNVTGMDREVSIGPIITPDIRPISIYSPLPAKLEDDGQLKLQVRAGQWDIHVKNRFLQQQNSFSFQPPNSPWPDNEVWVFDAENALRRVDVKGAQAIDPTQTNMPDNWKNFPAYLMKAGTQLTLDEKHRGKVKDRGEQLSVNRKIWLDFKGSGFTFEDQITGVVEDNWRLQAMAPLQLGKVDINGQAQLITKMPDETEPGVEIRNGHLNLVATSRLDKALQKMPAVGWHRDVQSLQATLYLPPGWKLFHVMGVDKVSDAWLRDWNLLDLFTVLFISLASIKILGLGFGALALLTLTLIYHEPGAPIWTWLLVIANLALLRVVPKGNIKLILNYTYVAFMILLVLLLIPFAGKQIQTALYPQLNKADPIVQPYSRSQLVGQGAMMDRGMEMESIASADSMQLQKAPKLKSRNKFASSPLEEQAQELREYDPSLKVQTGPGLPNWSWQNISLNWQGPVNQQQMLSLWLLPAWLVSIIKYCQVLFVLLLFYALTKPFKNAGFKKDLIGPFKGGAKTIPAILVALVASGLSPYSLKPAQAEIPGQALLTELREYILKPAECFPSCADLAKAHININDQQLTVRLNVHTLEEVAVPLPMAYEGWSIQQVLIDDQTAKAITKDNQNRIWVLTPKGQHEIVLLGRVTESSQFILNFDNLFRPKLVETQFNGWTISGLLDHKLTGQSLQFNKQLAQSQATEQKLKLSEMPSFVHYQRRIQLGLDWKIHHEVQRIAPARGAIHLSLPLLKGENVLSPQVKTQNGQAKVQLGLGQNRVFWESELEITPTILLKASNLPEVKESWYLQANPKWHLKFVGIPMIHQQSQAGVFAPFWQPWPDETLEVNILKPEAVSGETLTIQQTRYEINPGLRQSDHLLDVQLNSSQGAQHAIALPDNVTIQDILINNVSQPINLEGNKVVFPVQPGDQNLQIKWQSNDALSWQFKTPKVLLNQNATNNVLQVNLSKDRWILYLSGPEIGPVVQYWAVVILMVLVAVALGLSSLTPLAIWQWILLGLGVSLSTPLAAIFVVLWFIAMQSRLKFGKNLTTLQFQFLQCSLAVLTAVFIIAVINCISTGLLGNPQMQLAAPKSNLVFSKFWGAVYQFQWYQDKVSNQLPEVWVLSIPMYVYRILMLIWALWLAFSLIKWFQWGWHCFSKDGIIDNANEDATAENKT